MRAMLALLLLLGGLTTPLHAGQQTDTTFTVEPGGQLSIDNHQGAVRVRSGGQYTLSTHNGNIRVTIPEDAGVDVNVSTQNGELESDFPVQVHGALQQNEVSFMIGSGGARLDLASFNGTVQLVRPR